MRKRAFALAMASALMFAAACGGTSPGNGSNQVLKDLHDPKAAPTATLPASAPTAIPAGSIPGVSGASGPLPDTYVVKSGDTLGAIATNLGVSVDDLARLNNVTDTTRIQVGQQLKVPKPGAATPGAASVTGNGPTFGTNSSIPTSTAQVPPTGGAPSGIGSVGTAVSAAGTAPAAGGTATEYTVKQGDTACAIAIAGGISLQELADANGLTKDQISRLSLGQLLKVPPRTGNRGC
jgi:LysM repeat protein